MSSVAEASDSQSASSLGFWLYLMTDMMLFASLFATYTILRHGTNGGVGPAEVTNLGYVLVETAVLLGSSLTCGLVLLALRFGKRRDAAYYLVSTLLFGATFLVLELYEFWRLVADGHTWQSSAYLTGYFTLVGTHGLHILMGLVWGGVMLYALLKRRHSPRTLRQFGMFSMYWHFLDLMWIFIFTVVYVLGVAL